MRIARVLSKQRGREIERERDHHSTVLTFHLILAYVSREERERESERKPRKPSSLSSPQLSFHTLVCFKLAGIPKHSIHRFVGPMQQPLT